MAAKDHRPCSAGSTAAPPPAAAAGLNELLDALPVEALLERRPVARLAPGRAPAVAAERLAVARRALAAALGPAGGDEDLLRHAEDRVAARLPGAFLAAPGGAAGQFAAAVPARMPLLLPLPLRPLPPPAPRPGLVSVLPLACAAAGRARLAGLRAELAGLGWRLALGELDAAALDAVPLASLEADLLLLRWSPALPERRDALRGADPQALALTGCDDAGALEWGRGAGLVLFEGPAAEAELPPAARP